MTKKKSHVKKIFGMIHYTVLRLTHINMYVLAKGGIATNSMSK